MPGQIKSFVDFAVVVCNDVVEVFAFDFSCIVQPDLFLLRFFAAVLFSTYSVALLPLFDKVYEAPLENVMRTTFLYFSNCTEFSRSLVNFSSISLISTVLLVTYVLCENVTSLVSGLRCSVNAISTSGCDSMLLTNFSIEAWAYDTAEQSTMTAVSAIARHDSVFIVLYFLDFVNKILSFRF